MSITGINQGRTHNPDVAYLLCEIPGTSEVWSTVCEVVMRLLG